MMAEDERREKARTILAELLGLKGEVSDGGQVRPCDHEDFYVLGGTSLMAAIAVELLRENGFDASLSVMTTSGNIAQILDKLVQKRQVNTKDDEQPRANGVMVKQLSQKDEYEGITIIEFIKNGLKTTEELYEEAAHLVSEEFDKTEILGMAFKIPIKEVEDSFRRFTRPEADAVILFATYEPTFHLPLYGAKPGQLLGVLVALPTKNVGRMPDTPSSSALQNYFDFLEDVPHPKDVTVEQSFTTMMLAVRSPEIDPDFFNRNALVARWNRLKLHVVLQLEKEILKKAKQRGYSLIETINASFATREACFELGYESLNSATVGEFAKKFHLSVDPKYHSHRCHYMIKRLNE